MGLLHFTAGAIEQSGGVVRHNLCPRRSVGTRRSPVAEPVEARWLILESRSHAGAWERVETRTLSPHRPNDIHLAFLDRYHESVLEYAVKEEWGISEKVCQAVSGVISSSWYFAERICLIFTDLNYFFGQFFHIFI